jgi:hypothetical protein
LSTAILLLKNFDISAYTPGERKFLKTMARLMSPSNHFQLIRMTMETNLHPEIGMIPFVCPYLQGLYRLESDKNIAGTVDKSPIYRKLIALANLSVPCQKFSPKHQQILGCLGVLI